LREERRLRVFENGVLGKVFGSKRAEVPGEWRRLHKEFCDLYCTPNVIGVMKLRRMRCVGHVARMWGSRDAFRVLVGRSDGRRIVGRPRHIYEKNIKWVFKKWDVDLDWIDLAQDRDRWWAVVHAVMNLRFP